MRAFHLLPALISRARTSSGWRWLLNVVLRVVIPFNRPHGFAVTAIGTEEITTKADYRRSNWNHVKSIHACAIATVAEFSAGFLLLCVLDPKKYRLIMSSIELTYHYQAKETIYSTTRFPAEQLHNDVVAPLKNADRVVITLPSTIMDASGNVIASATTTWQIKQWDQVRTKV